MIRVSQLKLTIEFIPEPLWGQSIAQRYPRQWNKLRRAAYAEAGHRCEVCGGVGFRGSMINPGGLEAHEVWEYEFHGDDAVQRLVRLIALCPRCHQCKHMGRSYRVMPRAAYRDLVEHFLTVNELSEQQYAEYRAELTTEWWRNNTLNWSQDLSAFLTG